MRHTKHLTSQPLKIFIGLILQTSVFVGVGQILPTQVSAQTPTNATVSSSFQVENSRVLPSSDDGATVPTDFNSEDLPSSDQTSSPPTEEATNSTGTEEGTEKSDLQKAMTAGKLLFEAFEKILSE